MTNGELQRKAEYEALDTTLVESLRLAIACRPGLRARLLAVLGSEDRPEPEHKEGDWFVTGSVCSNIVVVTGDPIWHNAETGWRYPCETVLGTRLGYVSLRVPDDWLPIPAAVAAKLNAEEPT